MILATVLVVTAGLVTRNPWVLAGAGAASALAWFARPDPDPGRWARGAAGEVATAELLGRLPRRDAVFHDRHLPGARGNIDHLVVGRSGVWVIDSKSRRAPLRIRRGQVWAGEHIIDPGPAARQAAAVSQLLGVPVGAIVAVHGQGLRRRGKEVRGVPIVPATRLVRRLRRGRCLRRADIVALAAEADRLLPPVGAVGITRGRVDD